jgi:hypothetical protein
MDRKTIKEFVEQVAEIKEAKPVRVPHIRQDSVPEDGEVPEDDRNLVWYKDQWIDLNLENNPTLGFKLIKLKPVERLCELNHVGCNDIVADQRIEKRLYRHPINHWRTRCANCDRYVDPEGTGFVKGGANTQNVYIRYFASLERKK